MAPKKQQQQKGKGSKQGNSTAKDRGGDTAGASKKNKGAAQVQISSEKERKLRQLLQNTGNLHGGLAPGGKQHHQQEELSVGQKKSAERRLRSIYETLLSEGFSPAQIEQALAALHVGGASLEAALDWLCLNIPANELPEKFSSGLSLEEDSEGGSRSIQVLTVARADWAPATKPDNAERLDQSSAAIAKPTPVFKEAKPEKVVQAEQADWIRRYIADQGEDSGSGSGSQGDESGDSDWEMFSHPSEQHRRKEKRQVLDPHTRSLTIATEFQKAKEAAAQAKRMGDKEKQSAASHLIRELRQEIASLGLSESLLDQKIPKNSFSGLGHNDFPSLGESHSITSASVEKAKDSGFPSLGEAQRKAVPDGQGTKTTGDPADDHRKSTGVSFASLMKGGKVAALESRKPEVSNMMNVSVRKNLPAWAQRVDDEESGIGGLVNNAGEQEVETRAFSEAEDNTSENGQDIVEEAAEHKVSAKTTESIGPNGEVPLKPEKSTHDSESHENSKGAILERESMDEEDGLLGMFDEENSADHQLPETVVNVQKSSRITAWGMETSGIRQKKGALSKKSNQQSSQDDSLRQPKALLQQHCQKNEWASPRYEKLSTRGRMYAYTVTVTRPTVGRGKSKVIGGPILCKLPEKEDYFDTIADAQNAVATWALYTLLPDLPLYDMLPEPYRTMCLRWQTSGQDAKKEIKGQEVRRFSFVDSLVNSSFSGDVTPEVGGPSERSKTEMPNFDDQTRFNKSFTKDDKSAARKEAESLDLRRRQEEKSLNDDYKAMLKSRVALPMAAVKDDFLRKVRESEVVVVSGETGCGKTTQVPQYILDEMIAAGRGGSCNIICTQPRRIAAISVAERVAAERCETSPGSRGSLVGYQVRLDTAWNASTKLLFCTTGILLRRLGGDGNLDGVSHVVVDEVHERSILGDFLLVILKDLLLRRRSSGSPLKLILMSATLDSELFSKYFGDSPVIKAEGRTFPVKTQYLEDVHDLLHYRLASDSSAAMHNDYKASKSKASRNLVDSSRRRQHLVHSGWGDDQSLEDIPQNPYYEHELYASYSERTRVNLAMLNEDVIDYDLVEDLIIHIDEDGELGAILVFLPGMAEIQFMWDRLAVSKRFSGSAVEWLLPLHSSVASIDQKKVFQTPPHGLRKVVLATNIAETSITIDDVVHVIDSGKHKENRFNPRRGMSSMVEAWISQANAKQRSGRAGRVRPGNCYCLYTRNRFNKLLRPFQLPEIMRVPLVELCLQIKLLKLGNISSVLERALEPPKADAILNAISTLRQVGALDEAEALTSLGYHLANLPVDVRVGKMMLFGAVLGCLSPILTIAACLSHKSPFTSPQDQREAAERARQILVSDKGQDGTGANIASGQQSDHLAMVAAYDGWRNAASLKGAKAARDYCSSNFLSGPTLTMLRWAFVLQGVVLAKEFDVIGPPMGVMTAARAVQQLTKSRLLELPAPPSQFKAYDPLILKKACKDMRNQFASLLADIGFIRDPKGDQLARKPGKLEALVNDLQQSFNRNAHLPSVVKAALCAGLYPNVAAMTEESVQAGHAGALSRRAGLASAERTRWSDGRREVFVHPSSINHKVAEFRHPFVVFHEKVETSRVYLRDTTIISPYALLLFGGAINVQHQTGRVTVDAWLEMNSPAQTAVLFKNLRAALDSLLNEHIRAPQGTLSSHTREVISSITSLLVDEEKVPS